MDDSFSDFVELSQQWIDEAVAAGWLPNLAKEKSESITLESPGTLFSVSEQRPLVVAFFGGTGVGKSSLLNRLAGTNIARTGVERPTSREVSAFIHESVRLTHLPSDFPSEKISITRHSLAEYRNVLWLDMPDIDSVDHKNREIVFQWLAHIDVLVYVMSPDRYRDNRGWQVLLSHGYNHAWLFVMNHWDRGHPSQLDDLKKNISQTGFQNPIVLCSDCLNDSPDEFDKLGKTITSLAQGNRIHQLDQHGEKLRVQGLAKTIEHWLNTLGPKDARETLALEWVTNWGQVKQSIRKGLDWSVQQIAQNYPPIRSKDRRSEIALDKGRSIPFGNSSWNLWDDWAQTRLEDALSSIQIKCGAIAMPLKPLKRRMTQLNEKASEIIHGQVEHSLRESLAGSETGVRRFLLILLKTTAIALPLLTASWVVYRVVNSFYVAGNTESGYLGINFAVHSLLLVISSWFLPWFALRQFKPSHQHLATRGLTKGLNLGLDLLDRKVIGTLDEIEKERLHFSTIGGNLLAQCRKLAESRLKPGDQVLQRVLKQPG